MNYGPAILSVTVTVLLAVIGLFFEPGISRLVYQNWNDGAERFVRTCTKSPVNLKASALNFGALPSSSKNVPIVASCVGRMLTGEVSIGAGRRSPDDDRS